MKNLLIICICLFIGTSALAQNNATSTNARLCDANNVHHLVYKGQQEALSPLSNDAILSKLNSELAYLKSHSNFNGTGTIKLVINCRGEFVKAKMISKTKSDVLNSQIEKVFSSLGTWKAGILDGNPVDSKRLFSFRIKDGVLNFGD